MTKTVLFVIMLLGTLPAFSQRQLTVADVETLLPVAGVSVQGKDRTTQTDSLGRFALPDSSRTLVFSHVNYESRIVNMDEVASDTVFIISKLLSVKEVVVFGKVHYEDDGLDELRKSLRIKRSLRHRTSAATRSRCCDSPSKTARRSFSIAALWAEPRQGRSHRRSTTIRQSRNGSSGQSGRLIRATTMRRRTGAWRRDRS